jgi:uncharacterized protein (UPF0332 family)
MFYLAEALLLGHELSFSSHKAVVAAFGKYFVKTGKFKEDLHRSLIDPFEKRQFGDYESQVLTDQEAAEEILEKDIVFVDQATKTLKQGPYEFTPP